MVAHALETVVNLTEDGTLPRTTETLQSLQHWGDIHAGLLQPSMVNISAFLGVVTRQQLGNGSALGSYRYNTIENDEDKRRIDGGFCIDLWTSCTGPD